MCDDPNCYCNCKERLRVMRAVELPTHDAVSSPAHYTAGGVETIDAIEAWGLGFRLGNVVKYVSRAGKKDPARTVEDLEKARWYLSREIDALRGGK